MVHTIAMFAFCQDTHYDTRAVTASKISRATKDACPRHPLQKSRKNAPKSRVPPELWESRALEQGLLTRVTK